MSIFFVPLTPWFSFSDPPQRCGLYQVAVIRPRVAVMQLLRFDESDHQYLHFNGAGWARSASARHRPVSEVLSEPVNGGWAWRGVATDL